MRRTSALLTMALGLAAVVVSLGGRLVADDKESEAKHWAFQPVRRVEVPATKGGARPASPIDAFVDSKLFEAGLKPWPAAERVRLIRRLFLDLIGLPPTPEEVVAFLNDRSVDAVERVVDGLLARPQYGERWGRHWLDLVRYAETNGYERDGDKPFAWRYRDYVIDALNRDLPFDRFITEQLAGDEVEGSDAPAQIATTFLRLGTWDDEPAEPLVDRYDQLDDVLGTTATAFLGVTLRCARCHDHKFEPFSQADYYRMLAVFEPLKRPQEGRTEMDRAVGTEAELAAYRAAVLRRNAERSKLWERVEGLLRPEIVELVGKPGKPLPPVLSKFTPEDATAVRTEPSQRTPSQRGLVEKFAKDLVNAVRPKLPTEARSALAALDARMIELERSEPPAPLRAYIWMEDGPNAPLTHVFKRGDPTRPGAVAAPGVPAILAAHQPPLPRTGVKSSRRRLWLAHWLTSSENPLVARVIVNRVWQNHFGQGLVASANDFGVMGDPPSHPELLDWLARELVQTGWRLKPLHRRIVLSQAYQRASTFDPEAAKADPTNALLWRFSPRRLEAEGVRDTILATTGRLNLEMKGPSFYPTLPREVLEGQSRPGEGWGKSDVREQSRRSVYIFNKRSLAVPELELLDTPDTTSSCERRIASTTGPQALTFLNGAFIHGQAASFAARLVRDAGASETAQVERAYRLALSRGPRPQELQAAREFLKNQERQIAADEAKVGRAASKDTLHEKALQSLCLVILNMNEFVYIQ